LLNLRNAFRQTKRNASKKSLLAVSNLQLHLTSRFNKVATEAAAAAALISSCQLPCSSQLVMQILFRTIAGVLLATTNVVPVQRTCLY